MIIIINSSKTMRVNRSGSDPAQGLTRPIFIKHADVLANILRRMSPEQISALMKTSTKLTSQTVERLSKWRMNAHRIKGLPALHSFRGDIYEAIDADQLSKNKDLRHAQAHLRIVSGLYGLLRPLDQIQAYRLEMATRLKTPQGKNLYEFWGDRIAEALQADINRDGSGVLVNLVSNEYLKAVRVDRIEARIVQPVFKEYKNGVYKVIALYTKRARGMLTGFILRNALTAVEDIQKFDRAGYRFSPKRSTDDQWVFTRKA